MMTAIRKSAKDFAAIVFLIVVSLVVAIFILHNERLRLPFLDEPPTKLKAEFVTAQAVTPGQGQTVRVSGVRVGDITKVSLENGHAVVTMEILKKFKNVVHTDATALLRPKTGLKDMFIEINPNPTGKQAPVAKPGWTLPVSNTQPDVNPDEIFAALDGDSRAYLQLLVNGAGAGLHGRGGDLAEVLRRFEPTHRELARLSSAVATRRVSLARLVTSLKRLNGSLAGKKVQLSQLVDSSAAVFRSFAAEEGQISRTVADLPGALKQTTATLGKVRAFADTLGPAARRLTPAVAAIAPANRALAPFARATEPVIRTQIRPFVRAARPLVRNLRPASRNLAKATPDLRSSFVVLNHLFNTLSFNPSKTSRGMQPTSRQGYLFWLAWLDHQALQLFSTNDANAGYRPLFITFNCSTIKQLANNNGALGPLGPSFLNFLNVNLATLQAKGFCS